MATTTSTEGAALLTQAENRLRGIDGPVDPAAAYQLAEQAARTGHPEARRAHAYFTASGLGTQANPVKARQLLDAMVSSDRFIAVQLAFLEHLQPDRLAQAERTILSADPHIEVIRGLFSAAECRYLMLLAQPWLQPAMIYGPDGRPMRDPHRDSDHMAITPLTEDLVVQALNRRIADATATDPGQGEPLHVLRYRPGQQYRPHHDAHSAAPVAGRRIATALLYLNDAYEGGETHFPEVGVRVRGAVGDLLVFRNLDEAMMPDRRALHAGLPIERGEKWLATRWIRVGDYFGR